MLRETGDLKPRSKCDPLKVHDYEMGPDTLLTEAKIVIELKDGRRFLVPKTRGREDAGKPMQVVPLG